MIYFLDGVVKFKHSSNIVINVNGVGYVVYCTEPYLNKLSIGQSIEIVIYHHIKEDNQQLFGFDGISERKFFETLISVSGIGPKVAINVLSKVDSDELIHAIQTENIMFIVQCPGIGKKTAERLVVELKDKVHHLAMTPKIIEKNNNGISDTKNSSDDLVLALRQLGYQKDEIKRIFMKHATEVSAVESLEEQLKIFLKYL